MLFQLLLAATCEEDVNGVIILLLRREQRNTESYQSCTGGEGPTAAALITFRSRVVSGARNNIITPLTSTRRARNARTLHEQRRRVARYPGQ